MREVIVKDFAVIASPTVLIATPVVLGGRLQDSVWLVVTNLKKETYIRDCSARKQYRLRSKSNIHVYV